MNAFREALLSLGVVFCVLGYASVIVGKKKMVNWFLGIRWWVTMKDPEIWEIVNVRTGLLAIFHGLFMAIIGLCLHDVSFPLFILSFFPPALAWTAYGLVYSYQLKNKH